MAASTADAFAGAPVARRGCAAACAVSAASLLVALAVGLAVALDRLRLARPVAEPGDGAGRCTIRPGRSAPTPPTCSTSCSASPPGCRCWSA